MRTSGACRAGLVAVGVLAAVVVTVTVGPAYGDDPTVTISSPTFTPGQVDAGLTSRVEAQGVVSVTSDSQACTPQCGALLVIDQGTSAEIDQPWSGLINIGDGEVGVDVTLHAAFPAGTHTATLVVTSSSVGTLSGATVVASADLGTFTAITPTESVAITGAPTVVVAGRSAMVSTSFSAQGVNGPVNLCPVAERLQFRPSGGSWAGVSAKKQGACPSVTFVYTPTRSGSIRVVAGSATSAARAITVAEPTRTIRIGTPYTSSTGRPYKGQTLDLRADVTVLYTDGVYRATPGGQAMSLQVRTPRHTWKTIGRATAGRGHVVAAIHDLAKGTYRFASGKVVSHPIAISVRKAPPGYLTADFPQRISTRGTFHIHSGVKDVTDHWYVGKVELELQYAKVGGSWHTLATAYSHGSHRAILVARFQGRGYYEVYAPKYGLFLAEEYQPVT